MRPEQPFQPDDLADLDGRLLSRAHAVVAIRDLANGNRHRDVIGLRHDVDNHPEALPCALSFARWEAERGYRSSYYLLHSADYFRSPGFEAAAAELATIGHEVGIHTNAIAEALRTGRDPDEILDEAVDRLRGFGHAVVGVVGHGDQLCRVAGFANDEHFVECARPSNGAPDRTLTVDKRRSLTLAPRPLARFGLRYEAVRAAQATSAGAYTNTDSNGRWHFPFEDTVAAFERVTQLGPGAAAGAAYRAAPQTVLLVHPDWWPQAFPSLDLERTAA